tara:strand:- start:53 stop:946 length:894 start_codon:yes stop_codon:yes gene_type:complete
MKILSLVCSYEDYVGDCVLYGLLDSEHLVDHYPYAARMHKEALPQKANLYGGGYTLYCNLENKSKTQTNPEDILGKIRYSYYDVIVYASVTRNAMFLEEVLSNDYYTDKKIVFIDGEDTAEHVAKILSLQGKGKLFKRELLPQHKNVIRPICLGFPEEKICFEEGITKKNNLCPIIPKNLATYIRTGEENYYRTLQDSYFSKTAARSPVWWEAMRHYDILFNKSLPLFTEDLNKCGETFLWNHNKKLYKTIQSVYKESPGNKIDQTKTHLYDELIQEAFNYAQEHHTCRKLVEYILS